MTNQQNVDNPAIHLLLLTDTYILPYIKQVCVHPQPDLLTVHSHKLHATFVII